MTDKELIDLALGCGFDHAGELNVKALYFDPEIRKMCAADKCRNYGRCWTCPPYCGELDEITAKAAKYTRGILVQSTAQMEDDYDVEAIEEAANLQKKRFMALVESLREKYPDCLPMAAGGCTVCEKCACPDEPCRFPDKAIPSMEAYGLWVSKVCEDSGMKYYYGPKTITYSSCVLVD